MCLFPFNEYKIPNFSLHFSLRRKKQEHLWLCSSSSCDFSPHSVSVSCIISMPICFSFATFMSLRGRSSSQLYHFPSLLAERLAHSRSSAMPVSCISMNISRSRVVGTGPRVEGGESSLVYASEWPWTRCSISEPQFTLKGNVPDNRYPNSLI